MFFPRLRRHAKWIFVLLALVFGLGFVLFGVGAGGTGLGDLLRDNGATGGNGPSVEDARKRTEENPKDAQAFRATSRPRSQPTASPTSRSSRSSATRS